MNTHRRLSLIRPLLAVLAFAATAAQAFFPQPDLLTLILGEQGTVKVKGSSGGAAVVLQQVQITDGTIVSSDFNSMNPRSGKGSVDVLFKGLKAGVTSVSFQGTNNGGFVSGFATIQVLQQPTTSAQNPFFGIAGDPVNTATGEFFGLEAVDLALGGPLPLNFSRYVASRLSEDALVEADLGANRSHNFASRLVEPEEGFKQVLLPNGRGLLFRRSGGDWQLSAPRDMPYQLVETEDGFLLGHPQSQQIWSYDANGRLTRMEDGRGNMLTLTYTGGDLTQVSDGLGRELNFTYSGGRISSVTDQTGERTVNYTYTGGVLTSVQDIGGHVTTYGNAAGLPTSVARPEGNTLFTQVYTDGRVTSQTERGTDTGTLVYNEGETTFTDPAGETLVDEYDGAGRLVRHVDEAGNAIAMSYDTAGRRSAVTDRLGRTAGTTYHAPSGLPAVITNPEGRRTLFSYKARTVRGLVFHDLVKITWPDGTSRAFSRDARGNLTQIKDETGKAWKYTHNTRGQVLTAVNPLGGVTTLTYDANGNLASRQPPEEGVTQFGYDERFRPEQVTHPGGATVLYEYDDKDRLERVTDERGKVSEMSYDDNNRLTEVRDPALQETEFTHDALDRVATVIDRLNQTSSLSFNSRRLLESFTDRNGNTLGFGYDARQRLTEFEDAGGQVWEFEYDAEGRLSGWSTPVDPPFSLRRNALGFVMESSNPLGHTERVVRDPLQRVVQRLDPLGRQTVYSYDKVGRLIGLAEQGGGTAKVARDALGNVSKITAPNGGAWSGAYLKSGRLAKRTDPLGRSTSLGYDNRGRLASLTYPDATSCAVTHDAAGNLTRAQFSAGPDLVFDHDDLNRLTAADGVNFGYDAEGRLTSCAQNGKAFGATYDNGGRLQTVSYHDGALVVTYAHDSRNRLTGVTDSAGTDLDFAYDDAGRLTGITRTSGGVASTYTYDDAGRLTRIQEGAFLDLQYELNAAGEVAAVDFDAPAVPAVTAGGQALKFGKAGEIISPGYTYDALGRLTAAPGGKTYQWDGASRLVAAEGVTLAYNGLGDVVTREVGGQTTRFYHHYALKLAPIVYEDRPTGSDRAYVWTPGGRLLYSLDLGSNEPTFYHFDRVGSTLALSDDSGAVTDSYAYGPYGEALAHNGTSTQPFTYIGAYGVRAEGGLHQMRARYYDPQTAQFLSRDPLPPRLHEVKSLNPYAYASQSPLRYVDPEGRDDGVWQASDGHPRPQDDAALNFTSRLQIQFETELVTDGGLTFRSGLRLDAPPPLPGNDDTLFGDPGSGHSSGPSFAGGVRVAAGDFDGSGRPQLLTSGGGIFGSEPPPGADPFLFPPGPGLSGGVFVAAGDFDGSGRPQIVGADGGGIFNGGGTIEISNTPVAGNRADSGPSQSEQIQAILRQHFLMVYNALKSAEDAMLLEMQQSMSSTEAKVRAYEELKRQRKAFGKILRNLGGTVSH